MTHRRNLFLALGPLLAAPLPLYAASPATDTQLLVLKEKLKHQDAVLASQQARLNAQLQQIQSELQAVQAERKQIATLTGSPQPTAPTSTPYAPATAATTAPVPPPTQTAQPTASPAAAVAAPQPAQENVAQTQQAQAEKSRKEQARLVLQTNSALSQAGGVLTPKGTLVIEPSISYSYYNTNQINVNGFTIVPGITFGNININKVDENLYQQELTLRYGLTNRSDIYVRIPFQEGYSTTVTSPVLVGQTVAPLSTSAHAFNLGDIQLGGSYQLNEGSPTMPIFVANLNFKTATGTSPFSVPIFTSNTPDGIYLAGVDKRLPTGTGFYQIQPSLTVLYPTSPVILFANVQYIYNFERNVPIQNLAGGAPTYAKLQPGNGIGVSFGMGFSLNDRTSFSIGYEEDQFFNEKQDGSPIKGTAYDLGAFDFGLGYQITHNISADVGVSIGVGPNAPASEILVRLPISMNLFG